MIRLVEAHGFVFAVEGSGFHAESDFERGVEAIENELNDMYEPDVRAFAAEMMGWQDETGECRRPSLADVLEGIGRDAATEGRPDPVGISIRFYQ